MTRFYWRRSVSFTAAFSECFVIHKRYTTTQHNFTTAVPGKRLLKLYSKLFSCQKNHKHICTYHPPSKANSEHPQQTWELYEAQRLKELIDPALVNYPEEEVIRYIKVALFCIQAAAARRPSMPQVVTMLSKPIRINESELTSPGFIHEYRSNVSKASTSSHSRSKNSPSEDSNMFSTVVPPTVTEMSPR